MSYIKKTQKVATISLENVDSETSVEDAKEMREEILSFFEENPDGKLELDFGGYVRFSPKFAKELLSGDVKEKYLGKIVTRQIHIFDEQTIAQAIQ